MSSWSERQRLFRRWTLACMAGETLGITVAAGSMALLTLVAAPPALLVGGMVAAGVIEGSALALFQHHVLRERLPTLPRRAWLTATVLVAALGWLGGALATLGAPAGAGAAPSDGVMMGLGLLAGAGLGAILGGAQAVVLRRYSRGAGLWVAANAVGWAVGLAWLMLAASLPTTQSGLPEILLAGLLGGALAGLIVGAATAPVLGWLAPYAIGQGEDSPAVRPPNPPSTHPQQSLSVLD